MPTHRMRVNHGMAAEILQAIGDFVVSFAELEYGLKLGIQTLLTCSVPHKRVITAHQNVSHLVKMLRELYRTSDIQRVSFTAIESLCAEISEIIEFRNDLMHSSLTTIDTTTLEMEKKKRDNQFSLKIKEINIQTLKDMSEKAQYVAGDLMGIWMGYHQITPRVA